MDNPRTHCKIGYVIMFAGFIIEGNPSYNDLGEPNYFIVAIGIIVALSGLAYLFWKVRCPHCNKLVLKKLGVYKICPHCGKHT